MAVYSEEILNIPVGKGLDLYNHQARLEPGFCVEAKNFVANRDRLTTRGGFVSAFRIDTDEVTPIVVDTRENYVGTGDNNYYAHLPNSSDATWPVAMYAAGTAIWAIRQFDRDAPGSTDYANSAIREFTTHTAFKGACTYLDRIYINASGGIGYMTSINWAAGTYTFTQTNASGPTGTRGLFVFKDRLWAWDDTKIFYTEVPASPGAYPESWATANFIVIGAGSGLGKIQSIIPVGTQLYVFTENGLYTVAIIGSPINWVVRLIDGTISVNSPNCAYEYKGLVYFADTKGVWVTDGSEVKNISKTLEPLFDLGLQTSYYVRFKLVGLDDGILLARQLVDRNNQIAGCRLFYTPADYVAWTEFECSANNVDFTDIIAGFPKLSSHHIWNASNYLVVVNSVFASGTHTAELVVFYPAGVDAIYTAVGQNGGYIESSLKTSVTVFRESQEKRALYGYLNYATDANDSELDLTYRWNTEVQDALITENITNDTEAYKEALVKIKGPEFFRTIQFELSATCTEDTKVYDIFGVSLNLQAHRNTARDNS